MFLIAKIVRGRRLLHQLEQEEEKEKAQKEREKMAATKTGGAVGGGGGGGYICATGRSSRQQQTRQNSQTTEEQLWGGSGGRNGGGGVGTDGPMSAPAEYHHRPFSACPSSSSAISAGAVGAERGATGSIELNEISTGLNEAEQTQTFSSQKMVNKAMDAKQRRQRAVRQRTDSSLPSVDEELTADGKHNAKMRRTSSMPSVVESDSHGKGVFAVTKKGAIHRPIKHYNYEDRLSKLHKRALRFTWHRLQTRNGGKRIETVFEEVFDRMMRSFPVMREMFNTRTFISAMSRCEIATPRDHARLIVKMFESAIKNLEVEERRRTDTASDFDPNLLGRSHGALRPYGFTSALWEAFGEAVIDVVLNQEAVRDLPGASQAWVVLTACLVDQLRAGFESSRECPFQKTAQQQQMMTTTNNGNGGGGAIGMGTDRTNQQQQQQLSRKKSDKSNNSVEEEQRATEGGGGGAGRDNEGFLAVNTTENRRNTIASCSDSPHSDEDEQLLLNNKTMPMERRMETDSTGGGTTTARRKSAKRREQRCFSVIADKTGTNKSKLEMKIMHDMASTEL